jgi:hypothetical protein
VRLDPNAYAPGDVVKISRTIRVVDVFGDVIYGDDVKDNNHRVNFANTGTARVEMVKLVRRKPKTGEILTGAEVVKAHWKRGSMIRCTAQAGLTAIVLFADGKWRDVGGVGSYSFDDINEDATFEVLLVA